MYTGYGHSFRASTTPGKGCADEKREAGVSRHEKVAKVGSEGGREGNG